MSEDLAKMGHVRQAALKAAFGVLMSAILLITTLSTAAAQASGIRDTEIERLIRGYADPLLRAAGIQPDTVDIYILSDPTINAFVTRGSDMYIHTGLLVQADTPLQVKGVLAHEIGHIAGGHVARMSDAFAAARTPILVTMGLGLLAMAAGSPDAGIALISSGQHIAERAILRHSRIQESSADQAAITYLTRVGESGRGLLEITEKFRHMEVLSARNQNPYVRTHPLSSDRIASLSERVVTSPYADVEDTPAEVFAFKMIQAKLHGFMDKPQIVFRLYPERTASLPNIYARAIAHYRIPDIDKAIADVNRLLEKQPDNPYFHELMGQILFENGRVEDAIPYHQKSVDLMPDAPLLRINLAQALLATDNRAYDKAAIDNLETALQFETDNAFAWYQLAIAYGRENELGKANLATAERYFYNRRLPQAVQFAKRARHDLPKGTPQWQRATDIIQIAAAALGETPLDTDADDH